MIDLQYGHIANKRQSKTTFIQSTILLLFLTTHGETSTYTPLTETTPETPPRELVFSPTKPLSIARIDASGAIGIFGEMTPYTSPSITPVSTTAPLVGTPEQPIRLLSLDGGGIRGIIELYFLREIERRIGKPIGELFHLVAGTSIGAIIATGLTQKDPITLKPHHTATELFDTMMASHQRLFQPKFKSLWGLCGERYCTTPVADFLTSQFGEAPFHETTMPTIAVAQDLSTLDAKVFKSYDSTETYKTKDVLLASSAAPSFFKPHTMEPVTSATTTTTPHHFIDGGTIANNPSFIAYNEARKLYPTATRFDIYSLGTGSYLTYPDIASLGAGTGLTTWASRLPKIFMGGQLKLTEELLKTLIPDAHFIRWNPPIIGDRHISLDDHTPATIDLLLRSAQEMIDHNRGRFDEIIRRLELPKNPLSPVTAPSVET